MVLVARELVVSLLKYHIDISQKLLEESDKHQGVCKQLQKALEDDEV